MVIWLPPFLFGLRHHGPLKLQLEGSPLSGCHPIHFSPVEYPCVILFHCCAWGGSTGEGGSTWGSRPHEGPRRLQTFTDDPKCSRGHRTEIISMRCPQRLMYKKKIPVMVRR